MEGKPHHRETTCVTSLDPTCVTSLDPTLLHVCDLLGPYYTRDLLGPPVRGRRVPYHDRSALPGHPPPHTPAARGPMGHMYMIDSLTQTSRTTSFARNGVCICCLSDLVKAAQLKTHTHARTHTHTQFGIHTRSASQKPTTKTTNGCNKHQQMRTLSR
jgi:hypothetical protein